MCVFESLFVKGAKGESVKKKQTHCMPISHFDAGADGGGDLLLKVLVHELLGEARRPVGRVARLVRLRLERLLRRLHLLVRAPLLLRDLALALRHRALALLELRQPPVVVADVDLRVPARRHHVRGRRPRWARGRRRPRRGGRRRLRLGRPRRHVPRPCRRVVGHVRKRVVVHVVSVPSAHGLSISLW